MKLQIILIDENIQSRKLISKLLNNDFEIISAENLNDAKQLVNTNNADIIIIDPIFPKSEGLNLIKYIRSFSDCPIIAISNIGTEQAAVKSFEAGADDFIRKPFFSEEFLARIMRACQRIKIMEAAKGVSQKDIYENGEIYFDIKNSSLLVGKTAVHLTKNEALILALLCKNEGKVLTYDYILKSVWGPKTDGHTGILRVNIANLRKKIEKNPEAPVYLLTETGIGYKIIKSDSENI